MGGLIPLMLGSGSRASFIASSQTSPRRQSTIGFPGSTSPTTPTHAARPKFPKRLSLPAPVAIPVLPYTQAEWRKTIAEVKRKYFGKRYRACSARCLEVLDNLKDTSQVEPIYLIYLHFYAATSMEICARPLPSTSGLRASLLQQARKHFDQVSTLIDAAEDSVLRKFRPGSVNSSRASSCHSPSGSVSSRAWTPDTRVSSPTDSVCSFDDLSAKSPQSPPKHVKKVSFSLLKEESLHMAAEPFIRPDSPTLGFDDYFFQPYAIRQEEPSSPQPTPKYHEIELPLQTIPEDERELDAEVVVVVVEEEEEEDESSYLVARSVDRCCEHLSGLRAHLARHSINLNDLLLRGASSCSSSSQAARRPPTTTTTTSAAAPAPAPAATTTAKRTAEETRALDRQARIERLRKSGWQRKRFDGTPYEELCEAVLAELA
ncbi:hypothetical protein C8A00DRAFT_46903 [Chaetomidium leptoderma]|uniref:Uncharacterized protein n=1 Tax=Chaetomidium leptoderma TaxID=669021 RepID=A0AAN6ZTB8_9PEZI|nr:hypothetical protein C8A00DRAFT_46903 [Chaetomidium leptoderma]